MTPKQQAESFIKYFNRCSEVSGSFLTPFQVKQCALKMVQEITMALKFTNDSKWYIDHDTWWNKVRHEIEKY